MDHPVFGQKIRIQKTSSFTQFPTVAEIVKPIELHSAYRVLFREYKGVMKPLENVHLKDEERDRKMPLRYKLEKYVLRMGVVHDRVHGSFFFSGIQF
jgi:hypothetical protein